MSTTVPCYLVEWYRITFAADALERTAARLNETAALFSDRGVPVHLTAMLAVPADEVLFGVFTADSASTVAQTCAEAGIPAQRVTNATDLDFASRPE